jgi:hypothetical protein
MMAAEAAEAAVEASPRAPTGAADGGWRPAPSATRVLLACDWLRPGDLADPRVRIEQASSSHSLTRVTAPDGRCVVIKHVPEAAAQRQRSLASEMFVYRLARWMPAIAHAVPSPLFIDEARQLVVMEALTTGPHWPEPPAPVALESPTAAAELGALLAGVHAATAALAVWPSPCAGVLGLPGSLDAACEGRPAATVALMRQIVAAPQLGALLDAGAAAYAMRCLVHGDLRRENWRRRAGGALKLLDWELAGSGDPAWDVASLVAEMLLDPIRAQAWPCPGARPLPVALASTCGALLRAYLGHQVLDPDADETWRKLALYTAARLLHVACECADHGVGPHEWPVAPMVGAAAAIARATGDAATQLRAWSAA